MLTDTQQQEILEGALDGIKQRIIEDTIAHVEWNIKNEAANATSEIVKMWVNEELKPELIVSLEAKRSVLIESAIVAAEQLSEALAKAMTDAMVENLGSSYSRKKIIEALFN